jgi:hypothetical protein
MSEINTDSVYMKTYPELIQVLKSGGIEVDDLPVLDLQIKIGITGYIDFLLPKDVKAPIMKFKDRSCREGITFLIEGFTDGKYNIYDEDIYVKDVKLVLTIFERYTGGTTLSFGCAKDDPKIRCIYEYKRDDNFDSTLCFKQSTDLAYDGSHINKNMILDLLKGENPNFRLGLDYKYKNEKLN